MSKNLPPHLPRLKTGWSWVKLGDVAKLVRGVSYKKEVASKSPLPNYLPIIRANNINSALHFDDLIYVPKELIREEQFIKSGDIIIAMSSGSKDLVGKAAQAQSDLKIAFGTFCGLIRFYSEKLNNKFFGFYFQSKTYRDYISKVSMGVNINNLRREHIEELKLPLPPLSEQKKIVEKIEELFSQLDSGIAALKKAKEQLRLYRQSVLAAAFSGQLTGNEKRKTKDDCLPNGWKWVKLGELISPSRDRFEPLKNKNEKYIGLEHIEKGTGKILGYSDSNAVRSTKSVFKKGDLLYGKLRPYLNKVAVAEFSGVCSTDILVFNKRDGLSNLFLKYRMLMEDFVSYTKNRMSGVQHPRINFNSLSEFKLMIPSYSQQLQIVSEIEKRFSEADNLEKAIDDSLAKAETLRQSILSQAFSGKLL